MSADSLPPPSFFPDWSNITLDQAKDYAEAAIAAERERSEQDQKDAERYRWLRANRGGKQPWAMIFDDDLDRFIDAAIRARGKVKPALESSASSAP
jgi:hypothetical protein